MGFSVYLRFLKTKRGVIVKYRDADPIRLRTKLKVKLNKPHRKKMKQFRKKNYEPNQAMAEALKSAIDGQTGDVDFY